MMERSVQISSNPDWFDLIPGSEEPKEVGESSAKRTKRSVKS